MAREDRQDLGGQFKHTSSAFPISFVHLKKIFQVIYAGHFTFIVISDFMVSLAVFTSSLLTFFFSHCAAPPHLPSPAAGLLNYAFSLHAALRYCVKVETYFHHMCTSETIHLPQLSPFICHLPFFPQMIFRKKKRKHFLIISPLPSFREDGVFLLFTAKQLLHI